jgi:hypothetical protein
VEKRRDEKEDRIKIVGSVTLRWGVAMQVFDACREISDPDPTKKVNLFPKVELEWDAH